MTMNNIAETVDVETHTHRKEYYIPLSGASAGIPTEDGSGSVVLADGGTISRKHYPKACSVLESALGQEQFIMKKRSKVRKYLVNRWNDFVTRNISNHLWLITFYCDCYKQNPNWHPECLHLPDWRKDDMLPLLLKLATKTVVNVKLEPRGVDFE